ncbi:MAG: site-specific integrase, partial [Gemmatimonadota bacterium]|nr:site-specific integrase [Gemmatimonadota bacterium]
DLALRQAYELLASLHANEMAIEHETLTLGMLERLYLDSPTHKSKKPRTQVADQRRLRRVVAFIGPNRTVASLSESDVRRYALARKAGDSQLTAVIPGRPVRDRTIEYDLVGLQLALNWAVRERTPSGRRLLRENPLHGIRLPREKNPRQPVMTHDVYLRLLEVADRVHPLLKLALVVAEGTGRRVSAWTNLQWADVDFAAGTIRWRAEHDKKGYEQVVPMSDAVKAALLDARRAQKSIGNAPVFPAPKNPAVPCDRHLLDSWLRRGAALAEVELEKGGLWHTLRRKWATERKGYPVKDVAAAGGWRDTETLLKSYLQTDAETVRQIVLHPTQRLASR